MTHQQVRCSTTNPVQLQLNMAFTKAYLLDQAGSAAGLSGSNIFIDESVLAFARSVAQMAGARLQPIERTTSDGFLFALPSRPDHSRYHLGLECDHRPIVVQRDDIDTQVWKLRAFYPCDEDVSEFKWSIC